MSQLTKSQTPHYRLRLQSFEQLMDVHGWETIPVAARALGVADSTLYRAIESGPGAGVMAAVMAHADGFSHEHLFKLVIPKRKTRP